MHDHLTPASDQLVEEALRSHPISPMPRSITGDVMARIQAAPAPRFHLTRSDYLLSLVLTVVFGSIIFSLQFLPDPIVLQLRIQGILVWQSLLVSVRWLIPAIFFGLAGALAALTIPDLIHLATNRQR